MAKLLEKNGSEMCAALVSIAAPLKRFIDDAEFDKAWKKATKKGLQTGMSDILQIYADIAPLLFGENHLKDTMAILAVIEGKTVSELLAMNGTELLCDALKAFNEQIKPFFMQLGISVGGKL
jgi:hypothetical protein